MADVTHYQILGLQTGAPTSEIKRRYRILAKQYHPDNHGDTKMMARINDAYTVLADPKSRYKYDQTLSNAVVRRSPAPKPAPAQPQQYHVTYTDNTPFATTHFSLWKLGLVGSACAAIALIGIIAPSLDHQKPQHIATTNVSHQQPASTPIPPAATPAASTSNSSSTFNKQLAQEEAKLKQEEALVNTYEQQAQRASASARQDNQDTQSFEQQSAYNTAATQPISAPNTAPTLQAMRYGTLKGTYHYAVSYVSADGTETRLGPTSYGISAYGQKVYVWNIPASSNATVTHVKLYRTTGNSSATGPYYLVATLSNGNSFYEDNTPDRDLPIWTAKYE